MAATRAMPHTKAAKQIHLQAFHAPGCTGCPMNDALAAVEAEVRASMLTQQEAEDMGRRAATDALRAARLRVEAVDRIGLSHPKDAKGRTLALGHEEDCAFAYGNMTYRCDCLVPMAAVLAALEEPAHD